MVLEEQTRICSVITIVQLAAPPIADGVVYVNWNIDAGCNMPEGRK